MLGRLASAIYVVFAIVAAVAAFAGIGFGIWGAVGYATMAIQDRVLIGLLFGGIGIVVGLVILAAGAAL